MATVSRAGLATAAAEQLAWAEKLIDRAIAFNSRWSDQQTVSGAYAGGDALDDLRAANALSLALIARSLASIAAQAGRVDG